MVFEAANVALIVDFGWTAVSLLGLRFSFSGLAFTSAGFVAVFICLLASVFNMSFNVLVLVVGLRFFALDLSGVGSAPIRALFLPLLVNWTSLVGVLVSPLIQKNSPVESENAFYIQL